MRKKKEHYATGVYVRAIQCKIYWQKELDVKYFFNLMFYVKKNAYFENIQDN